MYISADAEARFVSPGFSDISWGIASAPQYKEGQIELLDECYTSTVGSDTNIEAAKSISSKRICATLEDNSSRLISSHTWSYYIFKELDVLVVLYPIVKRHIEGMVRTWARVVDRSRIVQGTGAGEKDGFVILVERKCHDAVRGPKSLLNAIAVMNVNVNVEYAGMVKEELQYCKYDIIDVAESRCFDFFRMVQPTGPIYCNIGLMVG